MSLSLARGEGGEPTDPELPESDSPTHPSVNSPPSYSSLTEPRVPGAFAMASSFDEQLRIAMELSCREQEELDRSEKQRDEKKRPGRGREYQGSVL